MMMRACRHTALTRMMAKNAAHTMYSISVCRSGMMVSMDIFIKYGISILEKLAMSIITRQTTTVLIWGFK